MSTDTRHCFETVNKNQNAKELSVILDVAMDLCPFWEKSLYLEY